MPKPNFSYERKFWKKGFDYVVGIDEVGRGAWAGPVVAAACVFAPQFKIIEDLGIDDSKRLKPKEREKLAREIKKYALVFDITEVGVSVINRIGIGKATEKAMRKTVKDIAGLLYCYIARSQKKEKKQHNNITIQQYNNLFVLVDGFHVKYISGVGLKRQKAIIKGDQKSISIAAASILAKVHRDKLMRQLAQNPRYKVYDWGQNKGYGTKMHQKAILQYGLTRYHRKDFVETWKSKLQL